MRVFLYIIGGVAALVALAFLFDRGHPLADPEVPTFDLDTLEADLAAREAAFDDIKSGVEARVIWAGVAGEKTDTAIVYLHGFSATSEEIRPVPDLVAEALGANLLFWRLPGHGRSGPAMAEPLPQDWLDSTAAAISAASVLGDQVIVMGTSTGGTLAARAAAVPALAALMDGIVFVSPNFRLANPQEPLLTLPFSENWLPLVAGAERGFEPRSPDHGTYWTMRYPTIAAQRLGWLMRRVRGTDFAAITTPALFLFSDDDQVVSAVETRAVADVWGGPATLSPRSVTQGDDPQSHVIAGDILSPGMTEPTAIEITEWVRGL
ncbi:MAG: alpha/beta fold hydrolase [Rhodobacteraceae bacterium]|nr:alpha/beta fold hydrolase [Paracoccaceae bacterium]